jgi:hypothetical protein
MQKSIFFLLSLLLFYFVLFSCIETAISSSSPSSPSSNKGWIVFISIPLKGHINPLLYQANVLIQRGYQVSLISTEPLRSFVEKEGPSSLSFIGLGPCEADNRTEAVLKQTTQVDYLTSTSLIYEWTKQLWSCMYPQSIQYFQKQSNSSSSSSSSSSSIISSSISIGH